jgi:small-conductance mechanosensitive channel/CRP-like cAMP-binding protein
MVASYFKNMLSKIQKLILPGAILLLFIFLTILKESKVFISGVDVSDTLKLAIEYIIQIGFIFSCVFMLIRLMNVIIFDSFIAKLPHTTVPKLVKDLTAVLIFIIGLTVIIGFVFGQSVIGFWTTSGAIGVVLGFALRSLILDVFTGVAINVDNSYKIGDWVQIHSRNPVEYIGCIIEINWRTTRIKTTDNNTIVVPNSIIGQSVVTNFSVPGSLSRFELFFNLDFSISSERCKRILLAGAKQAIGDPGILGDPGPKVKINQVKDSCIEYMVRFWIYPEKTSPSKARNIVIFNVQNQLLTAGIYLGNPKRDIYYSPLPPRELDLKSQKDKVRILSSIQLFKDIKDESLQVLAEGLKVVSFGAGETVLDMTMTNNSMFVVIEGLLNVYVYDDNETADIHVNSLSAGQFFGEMSLFSGEPRSASVRASTDVVAFEITYENMRDLFHHDPGVMDVISQVIAERHIQIAELINNTGNDKITEETKKKTKEILTRIKHFFHLA